MTELITGIIALVAVLLGWALNSYSNRKKDIREDKKVLKETLFFLLEIYHKLNVFKSIDAFVEKTLSSMKKEFENQIGDVIDDDDFINFVPYIKKMLLGYTGNHAEKELKEMKESYDKNIIKLSSVDPILAFTLKDKIQLKEIIDNWTNYAINQAEMDGDEQAIEFTSILMSDLGEKSIKEDIAELEEIILDLSKSINKKTFKEVRDISLFDKEYKYFDENVNKLMPEMVRKILAFAMSQMDKEENNS